MRANLLLLPFLVSCGCHVGTKLPSPGPGEEVLRVLNWSRHETGKGASYYHFTFDPFNREDPCSANERGGVRAENVMSQEPDRPCLLRPGKPVTRIVILKGTLYIPYDFDALMKSKKPGGGREPPP